MNRPVWQKMLEHVGLICSQDKLNQYLFEDNRYRILIRLEPVLFQNSVKASGFLLWK